MNFPELANSDGSYGSRGASMQGTGDSMYDIGSMLQGDSQQPESDEEAERDDYFSDSSDQILVRKEMNTKGTLLGIPQNCKLFCAITIDRTAWMELQKFLVNKHKLKKVDHTA